MKRILSVYVFMVLACAGAMAQEWTGVNRDDYGNIVRGSYLTNEWFDNWHVSAAVGVQGCFSQLSTMKVCPELEVGLVKWFTPSLGARLGYQWSSGREGLDCYYPANHSLLPYDAEADEPGTLRYGFSHLRGDLLWNITNAFWGYRADRFYNIAPYAGGGVVGIYDRLSAGNSGDRELAFGFGLLNAFRLGERLNLTLDMRTVEMSSRYKTIYGKASSFVSAAVGLSYNIYRTYWNRASAILADNAASVRAAEDAKLALQRVQEENERLTRQVAERDAEAVMVAEKEKSIAQREAALAAQLRDAAGGSRTAKEVSYEELKAMASTADLVVYFYINESKLNFSELHHLDEYIKNTLEADPDHVFLLTGSADKNTGTAQRNAVLASSRAEFVRDVLIRDFGVKPENAVIKATVVTDKHLEGALDRCCIIE